MTIKRYKMVKDPWDNAHITVRDDGNYVEYTDHLALVAAAYRDAAGVLDDPGDKAAVGALGRQLCCSGHGCGCRGADVGAYLQHLIRQQPPADAEAHLTALLRAEYERGVREAAAKMAEPAMLGLTLTKMEQSILALLTQEGR